MSLNPTETSIPVQSSTEPLIQEPQLNTQGQSIPIQPIQPIPNQQIPNQYTQGQSIPIQPIQPIPNQQIPEQLPQGQPIPIQPIPDQQNQFQQPQQYQPMQYQQNNVQLQTNQDYQQNTVPFQSNQEGYVVQNPNTAFNPQVANSNFSQGLNIYGQHSPQADCYRIGMIVCIILYSIFAILSFLFTLGILVITIIFSVGNLTIAILMCVFIRRLMPIGGIVAFIVIDVLMLGNSIAGSVITSIGGIVKVIPGFAGIIINVIALALVSIWGALNRKAYNYIAGVSN